MKIGIWYEQSFADQILFFKADRAHKNGGLAGILLTYYPLPSRRGVKGRAYTVPKHGFGLWKETTELPESIRKFEG